MDVGITQKMKNRYQLAYCYYYVSIFDSCFFGINIAVF